VAFGGRVAEEIVFNRISTGASNDIKQATELAQQMIRSWGMSEVLGPLSFAKDEEQVFLGREIAQHRDYSEETARKIDAEVNSLVMSAYERAKAVLTEHIDVLHKLAEQLLEKETILGAEMDEIIRQVRPGIELPEKPGDKPKKNVHADLHHHLRFTSTGVRAAHADHGYCKRHPRLFFRRRPFFLHRSCPGPGHAAG
jgi:cell division protease FtsH